jgi:hypothetical protein
MLQTGELVIADTFQNVIRALESRVHDKKEPLKVEKVIGDPYDDVWDALRYGLYSHHEPEKKPLEMRVQDRLNLIRKSDEQKGTVPDPTMAALQRISLVVLRFKVEQASGTRDRATPNGRWLGKLGRRFRII